MVDQVKLRIEAALKQRLLSHLQEEKKRTAAAIFGEPILEGLDDTLGVVKDFHGPESMAPHDVAKSFGYRFKTSQSTQGNKGSSDRETTIKYQHPKTRSTMTVIHRSRPMSNGQMHHSFMVQHSELPSGYESSEMSKLGKHLAGLHR